MKDHDKSHRRVAVNQRRLQDKLDSLATPAAEVVIRDMLRWIETIDGCDVEEQTELLYLKTNAQKWLRTWGTQKQFDMPRVDSRLRTREGDHVS